MPALKFSSAVSCPSTDPVQRNFAFEGACNTNTGSGGSITIGLDLPESVFAVGPPVTGTGTLVGVFIDQEPNTIFSGPIDGLPGPPTFKPYSSFPFVFAPDGLLEGGKVTWTGTGYQFSVEEAEYRIMGEPYTSPSTVITLSPADVTNDRIDVVYVDTDGLVGVLIGTAEPNPVKPQIDPATQIELTTIDVAALSTTPNLTTEVIYDEHGGAPEWTPTVLNTTGNFDAISDPYRLTKHIDITNFNNGGDRLTLTKPSGTIELTDYSDLSFFIKLKGTMAATVALQVSFWNDTVQVANWVTVPLNKTNTASYQSISMPMSVFTITNSTANILQFRWVAPNATVHPGFLIDFIYLQDGLVQPQPVQLYTASNGLTLDNFDVILGGFLNQITTIAAGVNYYLQMTGANANGTFRSLNTGSGPSIVATRDGNTNSALTGLRIERTVTGLGVAANNIGSSIDFYTETSTGALQVSGQIVNRWTDATNASRDSATEIYGVDGGILARKLAVNSNGQLVLDTYVGASATHTGTATFNLAVDTNGNVIQVATGGGGTYEALNGLNEDTPGEFRLGGTLDENTNIVGDAFVMTFNATNNSAGAPWQFLNGGTGKGMEITNNSDFWPTLRLMNNDGVEGPGLQAWTTGGIPLEGRVAGNTSDIYPTARLTRWANGTPPVAGMGQQIEFFGALYDGPSIVPANYIRSEWTNVGNTEMKSRISLWGLDETLSANMQELFALTSVGQGVILKYGIGTFEEVPAYVLGVDASGNIIEIDPADLGGGGGGTPGIDDVLSVNQAFTNNYVIDGNNNSLTFQDMALAATSYGDGAITGTLTFLAGWDVDGNFIEVNPASVGGGGGFSYAVQTLTDGATITMDADDGENAEVVITGTGKTFAFANTTAGRYYNIRFEQGDGNDTVTTWPGNVLWFGGVAPTFATGAGDSDFVTFYFDGTNYYGQHNPLNGSIVTLAGGGTGASLSDPGADRILFWDDSASTVTWLTLGTNLTITGTTLDAAGGGGGGNTLYSANDSLAGDRVVDFDGNSLVFSQGGNYFLSFNPEAGNEEAVLRAYNITGSDNIASVYAHTTNTESEVIIQSSFNGGAKTGSVTVHADTNGSTVSVLGDAISIDGVVTFAQAGGTGAGTAYMYETSGSLLTTPELGATEFDGKTKYFTTSSGRGILPSTMSVVVSSAMTLSNVNTEQPAFSSSYDVWTLQGDTTYYVEGRYHLEHSNTSHSTSLSFPLGGGASIHSIALDVIVSTAAPNATTTAQNTTTITQVSSTAVNSAAVVLREIITFKGYLRMNAGGTITPSFTFSAAPGGTVTMEPNSYISFTPVGNGTVILVGNAA